MKSYIKTFRLRASMKALEMEAPIDRNISRALAFFLRAAGIGVLVFATGNALVSLFSVIRWW